MAHLSWILNLQYKLNFPQRTSDFLFCESSVDSIAIDITSREFPRKTPPIPRNRARVQRRIQLPRSVQEWIIARSGLSSFISSLRDSPILFSPPYRPRLQTATLFSHPSAIPPSIPLSVFFFNFHQRYIASFLFLYISFICLNNFCLYIIYYVFIIEQLLILFIILWIFSETFTYIRLKITFR